MNVSYFSLVIISVFLSVDGHLFDRYSGKKVEDVKYFDKKQVKECAIEVRPCAPHEDRRIDGTCNNYKHPTRGSARGPYLRLLNTDYGPNGAIRKDRNGHPLPSARKVSTTVQTTGRVVDKDHFTAAATTYLDFVNRDISVINGPLDYLRKRQYCCEEKGKVDYRCAPIYVPENDPYLRVSGIRCLNFSRAETFLDDGCTPKEMDPEQINFQTPTLDLSTVYGVDEEALKRVRAYKHGFLNVERRLDRFLPLNETRDVCFQNKMNDSVCYKFGFSEVGDFDLRTTTLTIFFVNHHNRLARILNGLNPCWNDDKVFKVARQINIATLENIFLYELLPLLLGKENMLKYHLISEHVDYVTAYDHYAEPLVFAEYEIARRYFRTFLDGRIKKYNEKYHYAGEFSYSDTLFQQELIELDDNYEDMNRGTFYQHAAKIDDIVDPAISQKFYGKLQDASDLSAIDIQRGRDFGLQGYNGYRKLCGLRPAKRFEDFHDVMSMEKAMALKELYHEIEDVDLLAGIMSEDPIKGTFVGPTLFCIITKQVHLLRFADRFWFERGEQYHSFTPAQLHEARKTNLARFACDNADGIKFIQPRAFLNVGPGNEPVPCSHIPGPDISKWYDETCHHHGHHSDGHHRDHHSGYHNDGHHRDHHSSGYHNDHHNSYHHDHKFELYHPSYQKVDFYNRFLDPTKNNYHNQHDQSRNDNKNYQSDSNHERHVDYHDDKKHGDQHHPVDLKNEYYTSHRDRNYEHTRLDHSLGPKVDYFGRHIYYGHEDKHGHHYEERNEQSDGQSNDQPSGQSNDQSSGQPNEQRNDQRNDKLGYYYGLKQSGYKLQSTYNDQDYRGK